MANQGFSKVSGFETFLPKTQEKENSSFQYMD